MTDWRSGVSYCWDTSVLLAWLKEETCHPLADIALVVDEINKGQAFLLIPATTYEELQYSRLTIEQKQTFDGVAQRSNVIVVDLTPPIAKKAAEIILWSQAKGLKTKIRDARIAATAVVMNASVLHSLDPDLLRLDRTDIIDGARATKPCPFGGQKGIEFDDMAAP